MSGIVLIMENDFKKARRKLTLLYLCIVGGVVGLFSFLIIYQAKDSFSDPVIQTNDEITVSAVEAITIAREMEPTKTVLETEYEIERGALLFTVIFTDESEVKVDLFTGVGFIPQEPSSVIQRFTDNFEEMVGWIALLVFSLSALLSVYVANRTLRPIARNIQKQKQFVSGAAHELRNPLAALRTRIESVQRAPGHELKQDVLDDLLQETNRLIAMSESLLTLEKSEHVKKPTSVQGLAQTVEQVQKSLEHLAQDKGVSLKNNIGPERMNIDSKDMETILYNLVHNAIKFTNTGGVVNVLWQSGILTVSDTGIGIPEEHISHIFDRFYKVDSARSEEGSGLGLSIVSEIVARHSGTLKVSSVVGQGTVFTVKFD
jgi:signal transduction histidine kinase